LSRCFIPIHNVYYTALSMQHRSVPSQSCHDTDRTTVLTTEALKQPVCTMNTVCYRKPLSPPGKGLTKYEVFSHM